MEQNPDPRPDAPTDRPADPRPRYEPPRITKRRSVQRATLFSGANAQGPTVQGIASIPP